MHVSKIKCHYVCLWRAARVPVSHSPSKLPAEKARRPTPCSPHQSAPKQYARLIPSHATPMNLFLALLLLSTSQRPPTTVWYAVSVCTYLRVLTPLTRVTSTRPGGEKTTVPSIYTQRYAAVQSSAAAAPLSGTMGMGTQTGEVGAVRARVKAEGARVGAAVGMGVVGVLGVGLVL